MRKSTIVKSYLNNMLTSKKQISVKNSTVRYILENPTN